MGGVKTEAQLMAAMTSLLSTVDQQRSYDLHREGQRIAVMRDLAAEMRRSFQEMELELRSRVDAHLHPFDPLKQTWNAFRMFNLEYEEIRWTQWLAGVMRAESGARCARVVWGAFCDAVARRAVESPPFGESEPVDHQFWRAVASESPDVRDEVHDPEHGILDLLITTPTMVAAVENKLWAGWHDSAKGPQADSYRELAKKRLAGRRLALVLLSQREGLKHGEHYPSDYVHVSWRDMGQALRRALKREWQDDTQQTSVDLWPLVLTLVSIEQDLLGLSYEPPPDSSRAAILQHFSTVANYLEGR